MIIEQYAAEGSYQMHILVFSLENIEVLTFNELKNFKMFSCHVYLIRTRIHMQ